MAITGRRKASQFSSMRRSAGRAASIATPCSRRTCSRAFPFFTLCYYVLGLFAAQFRNYSSRPGCRRTPRKLSSCSYGNPLYEFFFKDFTHRYLGIHPRAAERHLHHHQDAAPQRRGVHVQRSGWPKSASRTRPSVPWTAPCTQETLHYSRTGAEGYALAVSAKAHQGRRWHCHSRRGSHPRHPG